MSIPPKGFQRFTLEDRVRFSDRWIWETHYRRIRRGFEYWSHRTPDIITREILKDGFSIITMIKRADHPQTK